MRVGMVEFDEWQERDIAERMEIDAEGVIRWKRLWPLGGEQYAIRVANRHNRYAGQPVKIRERADGWRYVYLYGENIAETRVREVLEARSR